MNIGFIGFSGAKFSESKAKKIIERIFDEIDKQYNKEETKIISGATMYGIPKLVYLEADKRGYKTIGVACKEVYDCEVFPNLEKLYVYGKNWGDESEVFINMLDKLYKIGGGPQSIKECDMAKNKNIPVVEFELQQIKD